MYDNFEKTKEYMSNMRKNGSKKFFNKNYDELNSSGKKLVDLAIRGDMKHNDKDAKKIINKNKKLYNKGKQNA